MSTPIRHRIELDAVGELHPGFGGVKPALELSGIPIPPFLLSLDVLSIFVCGGGGGGGGGG